MSSKQEGLSDRQLFCFGVFFAVLAMANLENAVTEGGRIYDVAAHPEHYALTPEQRVDAIDTGLELTLLSLLSSVAIGAVSYRSFSLINGNSRAV